MGTKISPAGKPSSHELELKQQTAQILSAHSEERAGMLLASAEVEALVRTGEGG